MLPDPPTASLVQQIRHFFKSGQYKSRELEPASPQPVRRALDALPVAVYVTDHAGRLVYWNRAAALLAGREPDASRDRWCVTERLYTPDGQDLPHDQCPMAVAIKEDRPVRGAEALAGRPDGSVVPFLPYPTPIHDESGKLIGAVNILVDTSELKRAQSSLVRRMEEQAALFRFTDRLYRAHAPAEIYEAALDAICEALHCERASILLVDRDGAMRFHAWRNLSDAYRSAVEGHSPWQPADPDPRTICYGDVDKADLAATLRTAVKAEGIGGLAFIPLMVNGALAGKFMAYYDAPHTFTDAEIGLAVIIAHQLGFAIERDRARAQGDLLIAELSHRVKNTLATVISIAHQSFSRGRTSEEARQSFDGRIRALAQTHTRLAETKWSGASLEAMLLDELTPYRREDGANVRLAGPAVTLSPRHAVVFGMAFHELATNAAKYGALSAKDGVVTVSWDIVGPGRTLFLRWSESGGPPVAPPDRTGFGRMLLERVLASDLRGSVQLDFAEAGFGCTVVLPLHEPAAS